MTIDEMVLGRLAVLAFCRAYFVSEAPVWVYLLNRLNNTTK